MNKGTLTVTDPMTSHILVDVQVSTADKASIHTGLIPTGPLRYMSGN